MPNVNHHHQPRPTIHILPIVGIVEGHQYLPQHNKVVRFEDVLPQLAAVEMNDGIEGILVLLNTLGGDVEAGLAIAEAISGLSKPSASVILGGAHSIGLVIAVAARKSFIAPSASILVHPVRLSGQIVAVSQTFDQLEKTHERIVKFVVDHSDMEAEKFRELMNKVGDLPGDVGTILVGRNAVEVGLIDAVGTLRDGYQYLKEEAAKTVRAAV